ncbi:MAG: hypothetical protein ACFCU7_02855 [Pleurocapsa sp.]
MTQLVINENYQYYKMRLPNMHLISGGIFMSKAAYSIITSDFLDESCLQDAISENQFSTGAINHLYDISNQAFPANDVSHQQSLTTLKFLINKWLLTIDLERAVIE